MTFDELLAQVTELLQRQGRVAYRILKRRFDLSDDDLEDLKADLIDAKRVAVDEEGKVLVWTGGAVQPAASQTQDSFKPEAERRQLTVMFCDLVGSTPLSQQLDPEELRTVILAYQEACAQVIRRCEGYLARYIGDGLLVYFGYPQAHEDDAQRAIRAGLGIVAALPNLNARLQQTIGVLQAVPLQVRIGIHTGLVVVGDMGGGGYRDPLAIVGETPNIAARVQGIAEPNTVVISASTFKLVQGLFECQDRGPQELNGVATPVSVYRVLRENEAQSRFEAAVKTGLTPLVGREEELGLLRRRWAQAKDGAGQVVLLSGEPGIGKSRLVQTLKEQVLQDGATRIEFHCAAYHQNSAFYPIIEHLQRLLQFAPHEAPEAKLDKLAQVLSHYRFPQADTLPLLAALLSLPHPEGAPPLTMSPQKQKEKTREALVAWIVEETEQTALYCAWEDLHWADPSTLEVLTLFLDQVPTSRLLALLTFRPDFIPPWRPRAHLTQLTLTRLGRPQVEAMVEQVSGGKTLPAEVLQQIVSKTDGVPLFVEELTKMVLESGWLRTAADHYELSGPLPPLAIPSTLQDSLMARLDRLATVREIAQLGATLGREFSYELLHAVSPLDEGTLQQGLRQLVEVELLYQRGLPPQATYLFKHALIQDTAYQSLLKSRRQQLHQQIAHVLEQQFSETTETQPELLAHHYTEAGLIAQAIPYWQQAGQKASERSANVEAINHLTKGLELLQTLPDTSERVQQELTLQILLSTPVMAVKGEAAAEPEQVFTRALELCRQVGETPLLFPTMAGLWLIYLLRAEIPKAHQWAERQLSLAQEVHDPALLMWAHILMGMTLFCSGKFAPAYTHLQQAFVLYDPEQYRTQAFHAGHDPGAVCLIYMSLVLWSRGYPDQAMQRMQEALTLAQEMSRPFSLGLALVLAGYLHLDRREMCLAQERAEAAIAHATEQGFPQWLAHGIAIRGRALAEQGALEEGHAQVRKGWAAEEHLGLKLMVPVHLCILAQIAAKQGQLEEGVKMLAEALESVHQTEARFYEAEPYRLKGMLTLQSKGPRSQLEEEAEECFHKAIEIARQQQAKSLELRAVISLSRLWQQQGKQREAHQMLAEIYGWFTEGFDTKDLQEAKALLEELV